MLKTCDKKNLSWEILYIRHCFFNKEIILKSLYYKNNKVHFWFYHMRSNRWIWSTIFNKRLFCSFIWIMHKNTNISSTVSGKEIFLYLLILHEYWLENHGRWAGLKKSKRRVWWTLLIILEQVRKYFLCEEPAFNKMTLSMTGKAGIKKI